MSVLKQYFGPRFRVLHWCTDQIMNDALSQVELTASQGRIMAYLVHRADPPCARDIEEHFHLSHPSVSGTLSRLEKKGFIEMRSDREDRRCKRIYLLDKGKDCNKSMYETICATENRLVEGFTEEEKEQFFGYLNRAIANMGCSSCNPKHKEETQA